MSVSSATKPARRKPARKPARPTKAALNSCPAADAEVRAAIPDFWRTFERMDASVGAFDEWNTCSNPAFIGVPASKIRRMFARRQDRVNALCDAHAQARGRLVWAIVAQNGYDPDDDALPAWLGVTHDGRAYVVNAYEPSSPGVWGGTRHLVYDLETGEQVNNEC